MTISLVGSKPNSASSGTAITVTHGLTISEGDKVYALINYNSGNQAIVDNNAVAFDEDMQGNGVDNSQTLAVFSKVAGASEPSSYNFTASNSDRWSIIILVYSSDDPITYDILPLISNVNSGSAPSRSLSITTLTDNTLAVAWHTFDATASQTFSNITNGFAEVETASGTQVQGVFTKTIASAGATGNVDATGSSGGAYGCLQFALKEDAGAAGIQVLRRRIQGY